MKSEKWYAAMHARKGKGTNQYTKAKKSGTEYIVSDETRAKMSRASSAKRHTEETKRKISEKRKQYLLENPDKVPYKLNHYSKGRSYAEVYWKAVLDSHDLKYIEQYQIGLYSLDFAFVDAKIDLEIDGNQHFLDERIVNSDKRRDEFLTSQGWQVIRIRWSDYKKLDSKRDFVYNIVHQLRGPVV